MVVEETKNTICSDSQQNILPINLDRDEMRNSSPQLSEFIYNFTSCQDYILTKGPGSLPEWMNIPDYDAQGCIKIEQNSVNLGNNDLNFTTIGDLRGVGNNDIIVYYFPESLNLYDGNAPSGGELMIELQQKPVGGNTEATDLERLLIFIPVNVDDKNDKSVNWFKEISQLTASSNSAQTAQSLTLNDVIPRAPFWIYNDISIHGYCDDKTEKPFSKMNAIFFADVGDFISIDSDSFNIFKTFNNADTCQTNQLEYSCAYDTNTSVEKTNWCAQWYPHEVSGTVNENDSDCKTGLNITRDTKMSKVNKYAIFKNNVGTTRGPGKHNDAGDPFSLTCEPIVDSNDDKPLDGVRTEWITGVYNAIPSGMKNTFWLLIFIIILTGILVSIHVFIFKNIGLFITQNDIAARASKPQ